MSKTMRLIVGFVAAGGLAASLASGPAIAVVLGGQVAGAKDPGSVTIKKIAGKKVAKGKKATIKPSVAKKGDVVIDSKTITVKKGSKTVAKNVKSVKLKAGKYKVTTKVAYRTFKVDNSQKVVHKAGDRVEAICTVAKVEDKFFGKRLWSHILTGPVVCTGLTFEGEYVVSEKGGECLISVITMACDSSMASLEATRNSASPSGFTASFITSRDLKAPANLKVYSKTLTVKKSQNLVISTKR